MSGNKRMPWSPEDSARLTDLWDSALPIKCIAEHFPGRTTNAVRKHGRYGLGLPDRNGKRGRATSIAWGAIQRELRKVPMGDSKYLAMVTGYSRRQILLLLSEHHEAGDLHIAGWVRYAPAGAWAARFSLGNGVDAQKPEPLTRKEIDRRRTLRLSKDAEYQAARCARARVRYAIKTGSLVRRDPLIAALYGTA
ncbi:SANT/Myb-like DNA-binding domain-containing protein [Pandoraea sp. SD6-2]|uniref:SANT/Myb-like DNA-binding domain-containing protein n=1 Tax=Pandoraea sp. SD6-2 TaxID=1286093 RepID=UPI0011862053|nr:SANT/Myb-like DNA-binding domain-containing protein [Pandoraea sp. SD6-2]